MAIYFTRIEDGLQIVGVDTLTAAGAGELQYDNISEKLNLHNGTSRSPVVTEAHDATLTNKTIDADNNTITNIDDADIKAGADIDRAKIVATSPDHVIINDGSGFLSSEATLAKSRGGSGQDNSGITFPASGVLVTEAGTQTLTNKTIDADLNTLSNIENADIKPGANIARNKLASGSFNHVIIDDGSGVLSSEATLATSRGGTNISSYTTGDLLYASSSSVLSKLPIGSTGDVVTVSGGLPSWQSPGAAAIPSGTLADYLGTTAPTSWILAFGGTIGNASSSGTARANSDTETLFTLLWNSYANSILAVSGGRGANAASDFAANKNIATPDLRGRVSPGKDDMGGSLASRITVAGSGVDGSILGNSGGLQTHTLITAEIPSHTHTQNSHNHIAPVRWDTPTGVFTTGGSRTAVDGVSVSTGQTSTTSSTTATNQNTGGGGTHNNVQPIWVTNKIIKL